MFERACRDLKRRLSRDNDRRTARLVVREVKSCCPFSIKVYVRSLGEVMRACNAVVTFPSIWNGMQAQEI
jgi:hypothetical protein